MDPVAALHARGGIARVRTLRDDGVSEDALRRAKQDGRVVTARRGWAAVPDADPQLLGAVASGVILSCVSVAERHGLWVPTRSSLHVAARPNACRITVPASVAVHWSTPVVPRPPDDVVDGLVNALVLVAQCQPLETALVVWESAMNKGLVEARQFAALDLPPSARAVSARARPFADSGLETIVVFRLRWLNVRMLPQAWVLDRRVDVLIGDRLVIQIDGATHTGAQRTADIAHDAQLLLHGFHVLRFAYEQIMGQWHDVQEVIMQAVAQGKHLA